jgi:hypothetical protein
MPENPIHLLWVIDIIAECATAAVIYRRRAHTIFPVFFSLLVFLCAKSLTLAALAAMNLPAAYFYVYWIGSAVRSVLICGVLAELSVKTLKPLNKLPACFPWCCMLGVAIIAVLTMLSFPHRSIQHAQELARYANERISWVFLVVLAAIIVLSGLMEASWSRRSIGITAGLLVELWIGSLSAAVAYLFGNAGVHDTNGVRLIAFGITNCIWIASFALPETETHVQLNSPDCAQGTQS